MIQGLVIIIIYSTACPTQELAGRAQSREINILAVLPRSFDEKGCSVSVIDLDPVTTDPNSSVVGKVEAKPASRYIFYVSLATAEVASA